MIKVTLSNPPPMNSIWKIARNRMYKTSEAKAWQEEAAWIIVDSFSYPFKFNYKQFFSVSIKQYPPDKRRRDVDGCLKLTLDAIEDSGVIENDYQVADLRVRRMKPDKENPRLELIIKELNQT